MTWKTKHEGSQYHRMQLQSQIELFATLKKTEVLDKYEVKFTVRPKNNNKVIKEKKKIIEEIKRFLSTHSNTHFCTRWTRRFTFFSFY